MSYWRVKERKRLKTEPCTGARAHKWELDNNGLTAKGVCAHCGTTKQFVNYIDWGSFVAQRRLLAARMNTPVEKELLC